MPLMRERIGVCRRIKPIPRPLYDPLADQAIVLWDPTVDDLDSQKELELEKLKLAEEKELFKNQGPHKSLATMLGLDKFKETKVIKVPVLIDPKLSKILRPHQVEGVKFLYKATTGMIAEKAFG